MSPDKLTVAIVVMSACDIKDLGDQVSWGAGCFVVIVVVAGSSVLHKLHFGYI
jgi:hypothetical protein